MASALNGFQRQRLVGARAWLLPLLLVSALAESGELSIDVAADVAGQLLADADLLLASNTISPIPGIPSSSDLTAFHRFADGDVVFAMDIAGSLPGDLTAGAGDVIRFDGSGYSIEWTALSEGLPDGIKVDAISSINEQLMLSFDQAILDSDGVLIADEDIALVTMDGIELLLDTSEFGVDPALDLDAVNLLGTGDITLYFLSFDGAGVIGDVSFDDEDVVQFNQSAGTWRMFLDGSTLFADSSVDLDAFFEQEIIFTDSFSVND